MLIQFQENISRIIDLKGSEKFLLAVSGGIDSICMAHLFKKAGLDFAIAHCNFRLRGEESDGDEMLVKQIAELFEIPFYCIHFNTKEYAQLQKLSIQVAARELRYNWFENLRRKYLYNYIAIAHNADDTIETFFINLLRGCGINGITGIKEKNNYIIRPLLFAHRSEIEQYCTENEIHFRLDSSNLSDKYQRNRLRNQIIPELENEISDFKKVMQANLKRFDEASEIYNFAIAQIKKEIIDDSDKDKLLVSIQKLLNSPAPSTILFEILKDYGFSNKTCEDIFQNLKGISGKVYLSENFRLIKDRETLIICPIASDKDEKYYIDKDSYEISEPYHMLFSFHDGAAYEFSKNKGIADFDADKLVFPLMLRRWQHGDYFKPLGLKSMKKVSDYFTDHKLSLYDKENCWILTSAGEIVWLIGWRIDDRFKITSETQKVLKVTIVKEYDC